MNTGMVMEEVERNIGYVFKNKKLLQEALTHSSVNGVVSYERLEFIGDPILSLAMSNYLFLNYPMLEPSELSLLRSANISTEKLARAAVKHKLHRFVLHNADSLIPKVHSFVNSVALEDGPVPYGGFIKAPKVLADIFESVIGAIYLDLNFDLEKLWLIAGALLEPILKPYDLEPQPVTMLHELCQKNGKQIEIQGSKNNNNQSVVDVFVEGQLVASASSDHKQFAKLEATKMALHKLSHLVPPSQPQINGFTDNNGSLVIPEAKHQLHKHSVTNRWHKPVYRIEMESGPPHDKRFVSVVQVKIGDCTFEIAGSEKTRKKYAENSAASCMIEALQKKDLL